MQRETRYIDIALSFSELFGQKEEIIILVIVAFLMRLNIAPSHLLYLYYALKMGEPNSSDRLKIVSEYGQEIPQSQTTDKPITILDPVITVNVYMLCRNMEIMQVSLFCFLFDSFRTSQQFFSYVRRVFLG